LIPGPEKPQPMRMQGNSDGPQGAGPQGKGTTQEPVTTQEASGKKTTGETTSTATGKATHKDQADLRRDQGDFSTVNSPITNKDGSEILVPKRVDLKTGEPQTGAALQEAIPDATIYKKGIIIDDKPIGRPIAKDRQEIIRFIKAYEVREGELPKVIAIQRYDPKTGEPFVTELLKPEDFLP
jgi:filamentous hemagglutinin